MCVCEEARVNKAPFTPTCVMYSLLHDAFEGDLERGGCTYTNLNYIPLIVIQPVDNITMCANQRDDLSLPSERTIDILEKKPFKYKIKGYFVTGT